MKLPLTYQDLRAVGIMRRMRRQHGAESFCLCIKIDIDVYLRSRKGQELSTRERKLLTGIRNLADMSRDVLRRKS